MKTAFSTVAAGELDAKSIASLAKRHGIDAVEIRADGKTGGLFEFPLCDADKVRKIFDKHGVKISDIASGIALTYYSEDSVERIKQNLDAAKILGAGGVRVFLGIFASKFSALLDCPYYFDVVRMLKEGCAYAEKVGVDIWVETHNDFSTGEVLAKLIEEVASRRLKVIWDIIHPIEFGEPPVRTLSLLGDRIAHIHIKDGIKCADPDKISYTYTKLGEGTLPIAYILSLLEKHGYNNYISLEWEAMWREELKAAYKNADEILNAYTNYMKNIKMNLLGNTMDELWCIENPVVGEVCTLKKEELTGALCIKADKTRHAVGKWVATVDVDANKSYAFSVNCETECRRNDVYVLYTTLKADGKWGVRDHAASCELKDGRYYFSDVIETGDDIVKVKIELWLKGCSGEVKWYAPTLVEAEPVVPRVARVALAFIKPYAKRTMEKSEEKIYEAIHRTAKVSPDVMVLSEVMLDFGTNTPLTAAAETTEGRVCKNICALAKQYNSYILYNFHEEEGGSYYNTSILIDRGGEIIGKYRKTHLTLTEHEAGLTPGDSYPVFDTDFGKVGMVICYDHYYPATVDAITEAGAEIVLIATIGDSAEKGIARAMDNGVYLAICGHHTENKHGWGPARIVSPTGEVIAHTHDEENIAYADIDFNKKIRRSWLSLGPAMSTIHDVYKYGKNHIED